MGQANFNTTMLYTQVLMRVAMGVICPSFPL
jgi:hypothetical protein